MKGIAIAAVILLASCAPAKQYVWVKPDVTQQDSLKDLFECRTLRDTYYHQAMQSLPPPAPRRAPVIYGPQSAGYGMMDFGDSLSDLGLRAKIKENAAKYFNECMESKGYNRALKTPPIQ